MESLFQKRVLAFCLFCCLLFRVGSSVEGLKGNSKVRGVNLGGWLVIEGWIKPSLFDEIPNGDMLDGTQVQFRSITLQKYISAENGGGSNVSLTRNIASSWETFRLWRVSAAQFQLRSLQGQFLTCSGEGNAVLATTESLPSNKETFIIERQNNSSRVHIKLQSGTYLQALSEDRLTADYQGTPGWDDNAAAFEMEIVANSLHGDYQLANGYEHDKAKDVLKVPILGHGFIFVLLLMRVSFGHFLKKVQRHRESFITAEDFKFLNKHGINTVRIPVGWWIAYDSNPPSPFVGGGLAALDNAFSWALDHGIKCIVDLHAAPGSQNGMEHSASRDGSVDWPDNVSKTLDVIDFLASRYANHAALLGFELLNEPSAAAVSLDVLVSYYQQGYSIIRKYSPTAYVIICQRIGNADPMELYQANIGLTNLVLDLHYYNLFDNFFANLSSSDNIQYIYKSRETQLQQLNSTDGPLVFIGEWVNEWDVSNGSQQDYQGFGKAQLEVYDAASFGWAYWTLKNEMKHWDFEWNIQNNYLEFSSSSRYRASYGFVWFGFSVYIILYCCSSANIHTDVSLASLRN